VLDPDPISGAPTTPFASWRVLQRLHTKHAWLSAEPVDPPWPLSRGVPAIASFYSFKGGVGRTTLLSAVSRLLAASGKRVVLLDLDLEAPGLGAFLGVDTERGVLDFIVDYLVTGVPDLRQCHGAASALGDELGARVEVIPAGRMNWGYVEKLGRLDFSDVGLGTGSSVTRAVRALVDAARTKFAPDYILIDSRAGLHDIGGLSLHALAHVDVLVARATSQNLVGLEIALQTLGRRKRTDDLRRLLVAHTFAPQREDRETRTPEEETFLQQAYDLFSKWIYPRSNAPDQIEQRDSDDAPHFPRPITQHPDLERINAISAAPPALLDGEDFRRLYERLVELCEPEDMADEEEELPAPAPVPHQPTGGDGS
jgi:MinD-like ATPase involved in chromosome partitioning or flagellar assembly